VAPIRPPPIESSFPIIAFWTTLLMMRRTTRSNGDICPSARFPSIRKATSRKT